MYRLLLLFSFLLIQEDELQKGIEYFNARAENAVGLQAKETNVNKAIQLFESQLKQNKNVMAAGGYLMQSLNFKARFVLTNNKERKPLYEKVIQLGTELIKKYPKDGKIRFEYISALALWAEIMGPVKSVEANVMAKMIYHTDQLILNDSMYFEGGGWKAKAAMNYKMPYIPVLVTWPDKKKAVAIMKNALRHFPTNVGCNFYYGEALYENGQKELALVYFQLAIKYPNRKGFQIEDEFFKEKARKYLKGS
jgi:tetratricopeptide (TPR) repeat protein